MYSFLLRSEIKEETLSPCYFFHGEETFLVEEFIRQLKEILISADLQDFNLERFNLEDTGWPEIIDLARTVPFFLSPRRIIVVEVPEGAGEILAAPDARTLQDYFAEPSQKTVLVVVLAGKTKKGSPLYQFFASLPSSRVHTKELRLLKGNALYVWIDRRLALEGKGATTEAKMRLEEIAGNDLRRIQTELEKLIAFVAEKKIIDEEDVDQVCAWSKSYVQWEISNSLEKGNMEECLHVINNLFQESIKPELALGIMTSFFRDILMAKVWIEERTKDKKEIFRALKPAIQERYKGLYATKFQEFFSVVEGISRGELNRFLDELQAIDVKIKTTDVPPLILMESFLIDYCKLRKSSERKGKLSWRE